jgi:ABC-type transport system involved in multi-copper enzyme maturation permease subunit
LRRFFLLSHSSPKTLFQKEVNSLFTVKALWIMLIILSLLTGYSFVQAVSLFSQASRTAQQYPEMARGMDPFRGVFVPCFGALYLVTTLLFPFAAIKLISSEKHSGSLKLLVQSLLSLRHIITVKAAALAVGWLLALVPALSAVAAWEMLGGHIYLPEVLNLVLGYTLYAFVITGIAFFAASLTNSTATAAILTLAFTLGSWVLDFATGTQSQLHIISAISLTALLRSFERGLFSLSTAGQALIAGSGFLVLSAVWLNSGIKLRCKLFRSLLVVLSCVLLSFPVSSIRVFHDATENRSNSFSSADETALKQMNHPLTVTVYLSREDSRRHDYETNILNKLQRTVPDLTVVFPYDSTGSLPGTQNDNRYGVIEYDYNGSHDESWSNSPGEVLPILHQLAGQTVTFSEVQQYHGYPIVTDAAPFITWFYIILPTMYLSLWWFTNTLPKNRKKETK